MASTKRYSKLHGVVPPVELTAVDTNVFRPAGNWREDSVVPVPNWLDDHFLFREKLELAPTKAGAALKKVWLRRCTKENRNLLFVIAGGTGSGKSYAALRLAQTLDKHFGIPRTVFTPIELLELIRSPLPPASAIVLDEAQLSADHKKWFNKTVETIRYITQTARFKNNILIFTTPDKEFIEKDARKLFHVGIEMKGNIDYKRKISYGKMFLFQPTSWLGGGKVDVLRIRPRLNISGITFTIGKVGFRMPHKTIIERYEAKRSDFMDTFYLKLQRDLTAMVKRTTTVDDVVGEVLSAPAKYLNKKGTKLEIYKIMHEFNISRDKARQAIILVEDTQKKEREKLKKETEKMEPKEPPKRISPISF